MSAAAEINWYERRNELESGQVFRTRNGDLVKLDRGVPGDGTRWYVQSWMRAPSRDGRGWSDNFYWSCDDSTIEPGDLQERLTEAEGAS